MSGKYKSTDVILKASDLGPGHPAIDPATGDFTRKAKALLDSRVIATRFTDGDGEIVLSDNPVRNTELFYRIADEIEIFPEEYDQGQWGEKEESSPTPCGAAFCIAGHAGHQTGWRPKINVYQYGGRFDKETVVDWDDLFTPFNRRNDDGQCFEASEVGAFELGLSLFEACIMFSGLWRPSRMSVPETLRALGDGDYLSEVTTPTSEGISVQGLTYEWDDLLEWENDRIIKVTGVKPTY